MNRNVVAFSSGLVFAIGLGVSGMTRPEKVIAFLDLAGGWDPSLAFVMVGAIGVNMTLIRWGRRRAKPLPDLAEAARALEKDQRPIDRRLLAGSALFGLGWGISGFCPGPAITSVATGAVPVLVFIGAMAAGMLLHRHAPAVWRRARASLTGATIETIGKPAPEGTSCG